VRVIFVYYHNIADKPVRSLVIHHLLHKEFLNQKSEGNFLPVHFIDRTSTDYWKGKFTPVRLIDKSFDNDNFPFDKKNNGNLQYKYTIADCNDGSMGIWHRLTLQYRYRPSGRYSIEEEETIELYCPSLHSLFFFSILPPILANSCFNFLRVLAVFGARVLFSDEEDTECWLNRLINLRYLGFIVCWVKCGSLGKRLDHLRNLQTLDLSESIISGLFEFIQNNTRVKVVGPFKEELPGWWTPIPDMCQ
jgi:hypothetical protein